MNPTDARKLTDAINALVNKLGSGGTSGPTISPPTAPTSTSTPGQLDALSYIEEQNKEYEKQLKIIQMVNDAAALGEQQQNDLIEELNEKRRTAVGLSEEEEELRQRLRELQIVGNTVMEDNLKLQEDANKAIAKNNEGLDKQKKKQEDLLKIDQQRKRLAEEQADAAEDIARSIGSMVGLREKPGGVTGLLATMIAGGKEGRKASLGGLAKGFKSLINPVSLVAGGLGGLTRIMQAAVEAVIFFAFQFDKLGSEIAKTTGHGRENAQQTTELAKATQGASATISQMTPVIVELGNELRGVNGISYETAASFAAVALSAERMGVSVKDTGLFMKDAMLGGGMSAEEAEQSFSNLNKAASMMGVNFSQLSSDFMSNRAVFAAYGQNMEKVFLRTSSVARQMGVELGSVLGMSDKFKTFEDSAGFVSEFNHMVGASLDPLEMMRLRAQDGPEAVAKALQDSLQMSGKSFDELSFAMREGIADSLGIPMNELRNMMEADVDMSLADEVASAEQPVDMLISKGNETLTILERIGNMLMQVAEQFATAFGFDQFAGGGLSDLLTSMETFIKEDLSGTIMDDFVPFMKVDMPSIVGGVKSFIDGIMTNPLLNALFDFDEIRAKAKAEEAQRNQEQALTLSSMMSIRDEKKRMQALAAAGYKFAINPKDDKEVASNEKEFERVRKSISSYATQAKGLMRESNSLNDLDDLDVMESIAALMTGPGGYMAIKSNKMEASAQNQFNNLKELRGMANGGSVLSGGYAMVGEKGPEIVSLPTGAYTIPNNAFARTGGPHSNSSSTTGGQPVQVNVRIDANDRVLRNAFTTTVEDVITGGA
tara:strand:- start:60364 stop:62847 length:2484 start_codon:yes stop_codon:yes gene_type:complete